jgi:pSer/pThr/pTyr-binding forkhead associated (FHA) protein
LTTAQDVATREVTPVYKEAVDRINDLPPQRVKAPLIIQFGPTIRTYNELPVVIGKHARCDFAIQHIGISCEQHAQIFFSQNNYWIKDLTGQRMIRVNNKQIDLKVQLNQFDEIEFSSRGPVFRYLGDGRLAEVETPHEEPHLSGEHELKAESRSESTGSSTSTSFMSKFIRGFK